MNVSLPSKRRSSVPSSIGTPFCAKKKTACEVLVLEELGASAGGQEVPLVHNGLQVPFIDISGLSKKPFPGNKVISLFSGAGGLDLGLEAAGFETAICIEIDADARETLRHNRPHWRIFEDESDRLAGDVRSITAQEIMEMAGLQYGEAALVVGGAPCQPFSNIGKKSGEQDPRNGDLFKEFVRVVRETGARAFLFENVTGITQARHLDVLNYMKQSFAGLGYGLTSIKLNAANYGVAQCRERFFLLGIQGIENPAFPLPTHAKSIESWKSFTQGFKVSFDVIPKSWVSLGQILKDLPSTVHTREDYAVMNVSEVIVERMKLINPGENFKVLPQHMLPNCWKTGKHQGQDTFGRLRLNEPSVTIRTAAYNPTKGKYIHPIYDRGLNTIEMAAIQSFPLEWHFKCVGRKKVTLVSAGRQIGNAVPPLLAQAIGLALKVQI
jgi:DNA (cytosine-5)-methyltransferase 1